MAQVIKALGRPSQVVPLEETGGKMLLYADGLRESHWAIEVGPDGRVQRAVETK